MYCEICGRPIEGEPIPIEVDKAVLYVCKSCAARYGKRVSPQLQQAVQKKTPPRPKSATPRLQSLDVDLVENFGEVIKRARENLGLSREALAAMLGIKEAVLRRIESGQLQPDLALAKKLEKTLGVKLLINIAEEGATSGSGRIDRGLTLGEVAEIRDSDEK
ncbi:transcriptional regulator, XRE family [Pyrobaculum islandicum DSM 4184]|uniref:Transcriptional regulator, XRE family n=1 Tax=Pyrobaculum islandicum (strain DSM 4184 / JCM 9189 / GEO3) TaxID=384616 RepID=A1RTG7_PYRIL|nr:multiprotein bridging factor aMBF1 [Pyrobaculum islandicum]ABL88249.1 transcriptional regulator, XRE family [Pyrobaculum islandicum DSM 4184]